MISRLAGFFAVLAALWSAAASDFSWTGAGPGLAMTIVTNPGPVIHSAVRIELDRFKKDFVFATSLASNTVAGLEPLSSQLRALPKEFGVPVASINADFFMMAGSAKGDPRGLHIWRGELVSVATGPAALWLDASGKFHGEAVTSKLMVSWPGGGTNLSGLNEQLWTNSMVLFTPRMGHLYDFRDTANSRPGRYSGSDSMLAKPGPIRPPGGREWTLRHSGTGPWLPLRVGKIYQAKAAGALDNFLSVPANAMVMSLGSNLVASLPEITNGSPVTITVATDPDLSGIEHALGTGPMLVSNGKRKDVSTRMSEQPHPRSAVGWNERFLYFATVDGRQREISLGLRLSEMADFMVDLGCREVINMDGGQSTTLILNGEIINHPAPMPGRMNTVRGSRDRDIANAIVVLRKARENDSDE